MFNKVNCNYMRWTKTELEKLYLHTKKSSKEISDLFGCSEHKVNYWMKKHGIQKRSVSEAVYQKLNPNGDPFVCEKPKTMEEAFLYGLGLGLYWGEGTKSDKHSVRLGNTNPKLIKKFIEFLINRYSIDRKKMRFGLQIFSDMSPSEGLSFWSKELGFPKSQFQKVVVTHARGVGTYRQKTKHGVLTVYYSNKKLRDIIGAVIDDL